MEAGVGGIGSGQKGNDDSQCAEQIGSHGSHLVFGNVLLSKVSGVVIAGIDGSRGLEGRLLIAVRLLEALIGVLSLVLILILETGAGLIGSSLLGLLILLILFGLSGRSFWGSRFFSCVGASSANGIAALGAEGSAIRNFGAAFGTKSHNSFFLSLQDIRQAPAIDYFLLSIKQFETIVNRDFGKIVLKIV